MSPADQQNRAAAAYEVATGRRRRRLAFLLVGGCVVIMLGLAYAHWEALRDAVGPTMGERWRFKPPIRVEEVDCIRYLEIDGGPPPRDTLEMEVRPVFEVVWDREGEGLRASRRLAGAAGLVRHAMPDGQQHTRQAERRCETPLGRWQELVHLLNESEIWALPSVLGSSGEDIGYRTIEVHVVRTRPSGAASLPLDLIAEYQFSTSIEVPLIGEVASTDFADLLEAMADIAAGREGAP
jgi:hypothetical protein